MSSQRHDIDVARLQEAELDACEAGLLRLETQLRYRHAMVDAQLLALRDRQQALRLRQRPVGASGTSASEQAAAVVEASEPRAHLAAAADARQAVLTQRSEHLAVLGAALQNWQRHLTQAEASACRTLEAEQDSDAAWQEREPAWRTSGVPLPSTELAAATLAVALPISPAMPGASEPTPQTRAGVAAAVTRMPALRVISRPSALPTGEHVDAQPTDAPQPRSPTKRMTTTPMFRPAESATVTNAATMPASEPPPAAKAKSEARTVAGMPTVAAAPSTPPPDESAAEPQPRTRVLVDSAPEVLARHAETVSIEPEVAAAVAANRLRGKRRRETPPVCRLDSRGLPAEMPVDLPTAHPQPPQRHCEATALFLATLTYCGLPLMRQSIEYDPGGSNLLLSFHGTAPALQTAGELLWRDRDGTRHRFAVKVLQAVPAQGGGTVVVLDIAHWTAQDRAAMQTVMARLM